jgi:Holliday junction DNA helicase RuvA
MIAKLRGLVDGTGADHVVVECGGVGYLAFCSRRTLGQIGPDRSPVVLLVETHVREDHIHLYGFAETAERDWFRLLITVQGVGAKVALAILSVLGPDQLATAIAAQDRAMLARADGVGPRLAARIAGELKDKIGAVALGPVAIDRAVPDGDTANVRSEAVSALVNLGYGRAEAFGAVAKAASDAGDGATLARLIPAALKVLAQ